MSASSRAILMAIGAILVLSAMDALVKQVGQTMAVTSIVFLRYGMGAIFSLAFALPQGGIRPTVATFRRAALRSLFIGSTAWLFFTALTLLPLAETVAITFTAPFFMVLGSAVLLGEPIGWRAVAATVIGFLGLLVMLGDQIVGGGFGSHATAGYAIGLAASVTYALSMIATRHSTAHDGVNEMVFAQNALIALATAVPGLMVLTPPPVTDYPALLAIGFCGALGHLLFAGAYKRAGANILAPLEYSGFLWATVFGFAFFGEIPSLWTLAGAAIIIAACGLVIRRGPA